MKTTCKFLLAILMIAGVSFKVSAQQLVWTANDEDTINIVKDKAVARASFPVDFKLFNLNIEPLRQQLFSVIDGRSQQSAIISLPNADGQIEMFEVFEASNFEADLQAKFPEIRAFSGRGITDEYATLKLSISPQGIQTMVFRTEKENEYIEPFSQDRTVYAVFRSNRNKGDSPWLCSTEDRKLAASLDQQVQNSFVPESSTGEVKTMRLAQSCNGEYANFFGATSSAQVALVLAAFNATLTRSNGVYEKDLGLHLNLIANTTAVIYYNPSTDPYTTLSNWNSQLQSTLTANIGEANYDIGHMFGASGGGGNAGCIGCVCTNGSKGSGITSPADGIPQGDNFDIDYVVHEVGHQLGANHTFSHSLEGSGVNKEVGSGITIMGYAGITTRDVAPHSIDIFHQASIAQIQANLATKTCPVTTTMTVNGPPTVSAGSDYTIPISTAFALTGTATDPQGDPITYNWEQNDNSTVSGANSIASPTKTGGPNWLSFASSTSPTRYMPRLSTVQAGLFVTPVLTGGDPGTNIEALSSVNRTLNFRLTVRDNRPYVPASTIGQTQFDDMVVTVNNTGGAFSVTSPNTAVSYAGNSTQTVTWNAGSTASAPFNSPNVKISLSTDGGNTFPTVLLASTANDGSQSVTIPNTPTTTARIKVEAIGNIFYDMSNANFTITSSGPTPTFTPTNTPTATNTATNTPTPTNTGTFTPTATSTGTFTPTNTPTPTNTATNTPTFTPTFTPSNTSTPTSTATFTPTFTPSNTATATFTPTNTATNTATPTPTGSPIGVTLPAITSPPGAEITVPITVGDTTGSEIISYDLQVTFDPAVLQPSGALYDTAGTLSSAMSITPNANYAGHLIISAFQGVPLTGSGTLINLKFTAVGSSGQSTELNFEDYTDPASIFHTGFQFNEGIPACATTNGSVTVLGVAISGTVTYGNAIGAPTPRYVSNVTISGAGSTNVSTTTAAPGVNAGQYALSGFGAGAYTVTPTKVGGVNNITSFDAGRISQHVSGTSFLTGNQLLVADVSNNGSVSSFDAAQIASYVVTGLNGGLTGTWKFLPASRSYGTVGSSIAGEDYSALLMGEVSGNWTNTGARPAARTEIDSPAVCAGRITAMPNSEVLVPVSVEGVVNKGIIAYEFDLRYDPTVIQPMNNPVDVIGTVSRGLTAVTKTDEPGLLRVAVYGPMAIDSNGLLLNLRFTVVGTAGSASPLSWESFMFNEGDSATLTANGLIEIRDPANMMQ
ncbi:MAG: peptidase [Chloracidobacterium sp.]|nr:peptidase [Chloracidobacterium sp.]